jgi:PAS domain S-box-containing protein
LGGHAPAEALSGRIAVIGASAFGLQNAVVAPPDSLFPQVEVHATAIDDLVKGDFQHRAADGHLWEVTLAVFLGAASVVSLVLIRSLWGLVIVAAMSGTVWIACEQTLARMGVLISPLPVTGVLVCNFVALTMLNYRTERKRVEEQERELASAEERTEELRQASESRYRRLVENVNDAIITNDPEGRLMFANRRFRDWFGLGDRDIRGMPLEDWVAPEWREAVRQDQRRRASGKPASEHLEYEGIRANGTRIWIDALITTVNEGARITGTQSALRDVTERKKLEAQYLQSQKMESVGRLAGGVAHDFNNLLTVINGYSELLDSKVGGDGQLQEMVRQIRHAGQRAAELTAQLLTFSRRQAAQPKPIDLNTVVEESQKMLQRVVGEDVQVETNLSTGLGMILADAGQMHQVLMNLVVNARDSMPDGGTLTIETRNVEPAEGLTMPSQEAPPGRCVCLTVSDTGTGMTEEIRQRIFEPFFTTKEKGRGTGLGLATVQGIVRQTGGGIVVESEPGLGTTFDIYFPRTEAGEAPPRTDTTAATTRGSETVLLVEDQAAVRQLTEEMLRSQGYNVLSAGSSAEAIALAGRHKGTIHLLITDVILPHMNGRVLSETLQSERPEMTVLYISGYSDEVVERRGVFGSEVAYLAKPYTADALAAKVREALGARKARSRSGDAR